MEKHQVFAILFILLFFGSSISAFSQKKQRIIKANSVKASVRDGNDLKKDMWTITPEAKPDVYETTVEKGKKRVTFITDIDSLSFDVKANHTYSFVILLNSKDSAYILIKALAPPKDFTKSQMTWLKKNATSLLAVKTNTNETPLYSDLEMFRDIIGNSEIVALGESTHGTSEFFTMKHRLLEYAVEKLGFRVFALEDNQQQIEIINNYVLYGEGDFNKIMYGMFLVWYKQEVQDMIKWAREYNVNHPDKTVEFVGFDMQNPKLAIDSLQSFLQVNDATLSTSIDNLLNDFKKNWANAYKFQDSVKVQWRRNTYDAWQQIANKKATWLNNAKSEVEKKKIEWAVQNANVIRQCALNKYLEGHGTIFYRDSAMAENISWIFSQRPKGTKVIVWAHDFHISRGDDPIAANNFYGGISMGSWLSKWYGSNYKAFGLETYSGSYTAYPSYSDYSKLIDCALNLSPTGSLDKGLHAIAEERKIIGLIVDIRRERLEKESVGWLLKPHFVRAANHVCIPQQYALKHTIPYQFDGIIFIDKTSGSKVID